MDKGKIFLSYSRIDGEQFTLKLAEDLRKAGANIWVDQLDIDLGKIWDQEVEKALGEASCLLFIATEKSTTSTNVLNEVYYALEENKEVIPVIAARCRLPFRLTRLQHIDFTLDHDSAYNRLLKSLNIETNNEPGKTKDLLLGNVLNKEIENDSEKFGEKDHSHQKVKSDQIAQGGQSSIKKKALIIGSIIALSIIISWILIGVDKNKISTDNPGTSEKISAESIQSRNEKIVLENVSAISKGDIEGSIKDFSPDIVDYGDLTSPPVEGIDAIKENILELFNAFPDYKAYNVKTFADADSVTVYLTWSGTFSRDGFGVKATGKRVNYNEVEVYKLDSSGKIISHRSSTAGTEAFKQAMTR